MPCQRETKNRAGTAGIRCPGFALPASYLLSDSVLVEKVRPGDPAHNTIHDQVVAFLEGAHCLVGFGAKPAVRGADPGVTQVIKPLLELQNIPAIHYWICQVQISDERCLGRGWRWGVPEWLLELAWKWREQTPDGKIGPPFPLRAV